MNNNETTTLGSDVLTNIFVPDCRNKLFSLTSGCNGKARHKARSLTLSHTVSYDVILILSFHPLSLCDNVSSQLVN